VASIQIYFEGAKFFSLTGKRPGTKPEGRRADSGDGVLGRRPHQLGVWESAVSSPSGVRAEPPENLKYGATSDLKIHYRMPYNVLLQKS